MILYIYRIKNMQHNVIKGLFFRMQVKRKKKKLKWSSQNGKLPESRQSRSKRLSRLKTIKYYQILEKNLIFLSENYLPTVFVLFENKIIFKFF